jgi:hypothetical protein
MAIEKTQCIPPSRHDAGAGQFAAIGRSLIKGFIAGLATAAGIQALLVSMAAQHYAVILSGVTGVVFISVSADAYLDWWLNRRLLCLGGDRYAIGIVWVVEAPQKKSFLDAALQLKVARALEVFDDDYSASIILSPFAPGDQIPNDAGSMWELVHHQESIAKAGLPTFGYGTTAAVTARRRIGPVSADFKSDPSDLPPAPNNHWEATPQSEVRVPAFGEAWRFEDGSIDARDEPGAIFSRRTRTEVPDTQLLHCEFEGTTIYNLRKWLPVIAAVSAVVASGIGGTLAAGGVIGSVLAPAAAAFVLTALAALSIFLLFALLIRALSRHGSPADANVSDGSDRNAGNIRDVDRPDPAPEDAELAAHWDAEYDLIGVMGRWVYDFGHSRGWNELHPVKFAELLTTEQFDEQLQASGKPPVRPTTEDQANTLLKIFESAVQQAMQVTAQQQRDAFFGAHPSVG